MKIFQVKLNYFKYTASTIKYLKLINTLPTKDKLFIFEKKKPSTILWNTTQHKISNKTTR